MDDPKTNTRLLMAAALSFAVMIAWWAIFPPAKPVRHAAKPAVATSSASAGTPSIAADAPVTASVASARTAVDPEKITFEGVVPGAGEARAVPYSMTLSNVGGVLSSYVLPSFRERDQSNQATERSIQLASETVSPASAMAAIAFIGESSFKLPPDAVYEVVEKSDRRVRLRYRTDQGVVVEREYEQTSKESFEVEMAVTVRNESKSATRHQLAIQTATELEPAMESGGFMFMPPPDHLNALCYADGSVKRGAHSALVKEPESFREAVKWVAMDRQYFVSAIIHRDPRAVECVLSADGRRLISKLIVSNVELRPGEEVRHKFTGYFGVKQPALLTRADAQLEAAVDYTILGLNLALICQALLWILAFIHSFTGSWGMAIFGLTVIVKAALFPLSQRAGKSAKGMATLKPEIDKMRERFKDDPQRQNEEMMKLWKVHGVNPASGCLPVLIQMPIWFALYRALWVSVDLYQEPFLWMPDLTARDPLWILPVLLVVVMYFQQKMTPSTMDATQQKVMLYFMPLMFGAMMAALPAGLAFYILVNSLLTILQQHFINRSIGPLTGSSSGPLTGSSSAQEAAA